MIKLPDPKSRMTSMRKAEILIAVENGDITKEEVLKQYNMTAEEFDSMQEQFKRYGLNGLRTTALQRYRL